VDDLKKCALNCIVPAENYCECSAPAQNGNEGKLFARIHFSFFYYGTTCSPATPPAPSAPRRADWSFFFSVRKKPQSDGRAALRKKNHLAQNPCKIRG
jgi:hypothetical protein